MHFISGNTGALAACLFQVVIYNKFMSFTSVNFLLYINDLIND